MAVRKIQQKLARGESIEKVPDAERPQTFEELAWQWFDEYVLPNNKFIEQRSKKYILTSTLIPFFGKLPVGKIAAHHIEQYKALQVREGVTNKTIKNRLTILNKCLVMASIPGTSINRDLASP